MAADESQHLLHGNGNDNNNGHIDVSDRSYDVIPSQKKQRRGSSSRPRPSAWHFYHPRSPTYRFWALLLATLIPFGGHVVKASLSPLGPLLLADKQWHLTHTQFGLFQSAVSVPNMVLPFLGGVWLDMKGSKPATIAALVCCMIGHMMFSSAIDSHIFTYALVARAIFGLGQGNTVVAQGRIAARWFAGRELVLAVALTESTHNIANFIGAIYPIPTTEYFGSYVYALWCGVIICALSLVAGITLFATTDENKIEHRNHGDANYYASLCKPCQDQHHDSLDGIDGKYLLEHHADDCDIHSDISSETSSPASTQRRLLARQSSGQRVFNLHNASKFTIGFILLCVLHCLFSNVSHLFGYILANMMATDWKYSINGAAFLSGVEPLIAIFLCPLFGIILDRTGKKMWCCAGAGFAIAFAYLLLAYAKAIVHPVIPLIILAVCTSFVPTVLRSSVPAVASPVLYGTAYGLYSVAESAGAVVGHAFTGYVRDKNVDYHVNLLIFAGLAVLAGLLALSLSVYDKWCGGTLNQPSIHHHAYHHIPDTTKDGHQLLILTVHPNACPCTCHGSDDPDHDGIHSHIHTTQQHQNGLRNGQHSHG